MPVNAGFGPQSPFAPGGRFYGVMPPRNPITPKQPDNTGEHFAGQPNVESGGFYDSYVPPPTPMSAPSNSPVYVPPGAEGIMRSPVNNGGGLAPDGSMPPTSWEPRMDPLGQGPGTDAPTPQRNYGTFRAISKRGGPEFRPSNTQELLRKAAARRLGLD